MAIRKDTQSKHDDVVRTLKSMYEAHGKHVWVNPGSEKNHAWRGHYIDVIVVDKIPQPSAAWVIEVETEDSVSDNEARNQWHDYDRAYQNHWYLVVPVKSEKKAKELIQQHRVERCTLATWIHEADGSYIFPGLPDPQAPLPTPRRRTP